MEVLVEINLHPLHNSRPVAIMMYSRINFAYLCQGSLFLISFTRWKKSKTGRMQFTTLLLIPYLEPINILPLDWTKKD
jgi:hypothetical protein